METIFMDTTAQADKFLGKKQKRENIQAICAGKRVLSSTYVLGEFKCNFLRDATRLYNLVLDSSNIGEAVIRFEETYRERITKRMCKLFGNIIKDLGETITKEDVLDRLEIYIEDILIKRFKMGLDKVLLNETECMRSLATPYKCGDIWKIDVGCTQKPIPQCRIEEFLLNPNKNQIDLIKNLPNEMSKVETLICNICNSSKKPFGNNCKTLGDVIISLEAPHESKILTSNVKDFKPICQCLQKEVIKF